MRHFDTTPRLTGGDYLLTFADLFAQRGQPFADVFRLMVAEKRSAPAAPDDDLQREPGLRHHEATPVDIIARAYEAAAARKDRAAQDEIMREGLALLARWPSFLLEVVPA